MLGRLLIKGGKSCRKVTIHELVQDKGMITLCMPDPLQHSVSTRDNNTPMDRLGKMDVTTTANVLIKPQAATSVPRGNKVIYVLHSDFDVNLNVNNKITVLLQRPHHKHS